MKSRIQVNQGEMQCQKSHGNVTIDPNPVYVVSNALRVDEDLVYKVTDVDKNFNCR